jgi:hypothetical protein
MANPWLKKNPFMSMWLSAANATAGSLRGRATAEGRRQATTMMTAATKQVLDAWTGALLPAPAKKTTTRKRKRR